MKTVMENAKFYKVVGASGESLHGGNLTWSLPNGDKPGKWHSVKGEIEVCVNGLHLVNESHIADWLKPHSRIFEAEYRGATDSSEYEDSGKVAVRSARLVREIAPPTWWQKSMTFIDSIPSTPFFKPDGNPDPAWKLFTAPTWAAAGAAAWAAAWDAAGDAKLHCIAAFVCSDLNIDPVHRAHAEARWNVWSKGYALLCDVNGVLYVYAAA